MSDPLRCSQGHLWNTASDVRGFEAASCCPLCGSPPLDSLADATAVTPGEAPRDTRSAGPLAALPEIPGYEILELLGRGGMAVVYRARQLNLNRLVALKLLREDACAAPEDLVRFLGEAE